MNSDKNEHLLCFIVENLCQINKSMRIVKEAEKVPEALDYFQKGHPAREAAEKVKRKCDRGVNITDEEYSKFRTIIRENFDLKDPELREFIEEFQPGFFNISEIGYRERRDYINDLIAFTKDILPENVHQKFTEEI